jgi:hypothetical protein
VKNVALILNNPRQKHTETILASVKKKVPVICYRSRDSSVGIATGYGLDDRGVGARVPVGSNFIFSTSSRPALRFTQPPIQWVPGALSTGVKRPWR